MSGGEPPRRNTALYGFVLLVAVLVLVYGTIELVQRHRFRRMEPEVKAVVDDIVANVRFDIDAAGKLVVLDMPDGRGTPLQTYTMQGDDLKERETTWVVYALMQPRLPENPHFAIFVGQDRHGILGAPFVGVNLKGSTLLSIPQAVESRLKARGLPYREYVVKQ